MDYTYLDKVKQVCKFSIDPNTGKFQSTVDDGLLSTFITAASQEWDLRTGQTWAQVTTQQLYTVRDGTLIVSRSGEVTARMDVPAINGVTAINWQISGMGQTWNQISDFNYVEWVSRPDGSRLFISSPTFQSYRHNLRLQIIADVGYAPTTVSLLNGGTATYANVPTDVLMVVSQIAAYGYEVIRGNPNGIVALTDAGAVRIPDTLPPWLERKILLYTAGVTRV